MVVELKVQGVDKLSAVTKALRQYGDKDLRKDLYAGINRAVKPLGQDVRDKLRAFLPNGYADELYDTLRIKAVRRATGGGVGVRLNATAKSAKVRARKGRRSRPARTASGGKERDLRSLNRGRLRHPLYGNRGFWFDQSVTPGFWDRPLEANADEVRRELIRVIDDIGNKVDRAVRSKG